MKKSTLIVVTLMATACGGGGGGGDGDTVETAAWANQGTPPSITSEETFSVAEGQTAIGTATASAGSNTGSLVFSLTGGNASAITVDSVTGSMSFNSAPDYETKTQYSSTLMVSDGTLQSTQEITINIIDDTSDNRLACKTAIHTYTPPVQLSGTVFNYYKYDWESVDFEYMPICTNYYEATATITSPWKTYISELLDYSKYSLGLILPVNAFILAEDRATVTASETNAFNIDFCTITASTQEGGVSGCVSYADPMANRSPAGGVGYGQLPNGADMQLFQDNIWGEQDIKNSMKIIAHEFFHVHQNSLKFLFDNELAIIPNSQSPENPSGTVNPNKMGIPKAWIGNDAAYDSATVPKYFPQWIEEGGAEFGGIILSARYMESKNIAGSDPVRLFEEHIEAAFDAFAANPSLSLEDFNMGDNNGQNPGMQYSAGATALMYLWTLDEANFDHIMNGYYTAWSEAENERAGYGWSDAFSKVFKKDGQTYEIATFYNDFNTWIRSDTKANLKAQIKLEQDIIERQLSPATLNQPNEVTVSIGKKYPGDNSQSDVYFINGIQQKPIKIKRGETYTFKHPAEHPLRFSTVGDGTHNSGTLYETDVTYVDTTTVILKAPSSSVCINSLSYFSSAQSGMGSFISFTMGADSNCT